MYPLVQFKLVRDGARLPQRATTGAGAFDIYAPAELLLGAGTHFNMPVGFAHQVGHTRDHLEAFGFKLQGLVIPRSGLATRHGIRLFYQGLIDHDYRGEIHVCLENASNRDYQIAAGERIAQIAYTLMWCGVAEEVQELSSTERGANGFGSTGR